jgi:hypothetical protein
MKKTLIALATLGVVGAASAQVSISGSIGAGVQNKIGASTAKFHLTDADINFSATEDLGGGMTASASTSISNEGLRSGAKGTTANNTGISISGGFGKFSYTNLLSGNAKMGSPSVEDDLSDVLGGYSTLNVFNYTTPEVMPGLKIGVEWGSADSADMAASGTPYLIGYYNAGPLNVYVDNGGSTNNWDLRVKYDMGGFNLAVRTAKDKYQEFGVTMPVGALTYGFNTVSKTDDGYKGSGFSVAYALSKQTTMSFGYVSASKSASFTGKAVADTSGGNNYRLNLVKKF